VPRQLSVACPVGVPPLPHPHLRSITISLVTDWAARTAKESCKLCIPASIIIATVNSYPVSKTKVPLGLVGSILPLPALLKLVLPANRAGG